MRCATHGVGFTLYPPGHVPYGRKSIAPVGSDGSLLVQGDGHNPFEGTCFDAAIDARDSRPWPAESVSGSLESRFRTQQRHMDRAARLLGIDSSLDEKRREQIAHILWVPGQVIHESAHLIENQHAYTIMGAAICSVLDEISLTPRIFDHLAQAGAVAGIWPEPFRWDAKVHTCRPPAFPAPGTRASPG